MRWGWVLTALGLGGAAAFMAWTFMRSAAPDSPLGRGSWTGGSPHILAAMLIGVLGAGALTAGLIWLAFYSARRGYDDRAGEWDEADGNGGDDQG